MHQFRVTPRGEFSLEAANAHFGGWVAKAPHREPAIVMAFPLESWDASAAVVLRQDIDGTVRGEVTLSGAADSSHAAAAWGQALAVLSLDVDGAGFAAIGDSDPVIGGLQQKYPGLRPVLFHSPYEAAAGFTIGHRISMAQGRAIRNRLAEQRGTAIDTAAGTGHAFPDPSALVELEGFQSLSASKIDRLHAVARAALAGALDRRRLRAMPEEEALALLQTIPGIGPFFSQGILMRGAGLVDAITDDDVTKQAVQRAYNLPDLPPHGEVMELAESWRPFRMWALVLLHVWFRMEAGGPVRANRRRPGGKRHAFERVSS